MTMTSPTPPPPPSTTTSQPTAPTTATTAPGPSSKVRLTCSLSGAHCDVPVVSRHSGHVFERRVIDKALSANGSKCPHTGIHLDPVDDLVAIKVVPNPVGVVPVPVPPPKTDVPAMLTHVINEWDARALEVQQLRSDLRQNKETLQRTRQELASALYRLDCALRLNARANNNATDERDRHMGNSTTGTGRRQGVNGRKSVNVQARKNGHDDGDDIDAVDGVHGDDDQHHHNGTEQPSSKQQYPSSSSTAARKRRRTEHATPAEDENEQEAQRNDNKDTHVTGKDELAKAKHGKDARQPMTETTNDDDDDDDNNNNSVMKNDTGVTLLSEPLINAVNSLGSSLSQARKARKPPRGWPISSELARMRVTRRCTVFVAAAKRESSEEGERDGAASKQQSNTDVRTRPYICSLAWMPSTSSSADSVYVGLSNGAIEQIDAASMAVVNNYGRERQGQQQWLSGHVDTGSAVRVLWGNSSSLEEQDQDDASRRPLLLSGGSDGRVRTWDLNRRTRIAEWTCDDGPSGSNSSSRRMTNEVVGIEGHALGSLFLVGRQRDWTWYDLEYNKVLTQYRLLSPHEHVHDHRSAQNYSYSTANIHPDGMFFALGRTDSVVDLWDVKSMSVIHTLRDDDNNNKNMKMTSRCTAVAMSEKGYYMATCCDGQVQMWDLRKRAVVGRVDDAGRSGYVTAVALDAFGEFGCAVAADGDGGGGGGGRGSATVFAARKNAKKVGWFELNGNGVAKGEEEVIGEGAGAGAVVTWGGRDANGAKQLWIGGGGGGRSGNGRCVMEASVTA